MIKTEHLRYRYNDGTEALKNISFNSQNGKVIGIIGGNGSGKTTLFMTLMGLLKPSGGKVYLNEKEIKYNKKDKERLIRHLGIILQDPEQQLFYSNIYDEIAFGLRNNNVKEEVIKKKVHQVLTQVGALSFKEKPIHFLSHGQKKRIAIASVIALEKKVIFFDEPMAGLDPKMTDRMCGLIKKLSAEGITIVLSSHNMDLVYSLTDYCYILKNGEVLEEGRTSIVFENEEIIVQADLRMPWAIQ